MTIPDYQSIMLPLLKLISDQKEYSMRDVFDSLAVKLNLSPEEIKELLPSGQQYLFENRVGWARTYLKKAGLLTSPKRGYVLITERGLQALKQNPIDINNKFLLQFPEFVEFQQGKKRSTKDSEDNRKETTPEETLELAYQEIREELSQELLNNIKGCSPAFFEKLVVELLVKMGYGGSLADAGRAVGKSGDEGIDGVIKEDKLGLDAIYIQAKRWSNVVGRPEIQKFVGALYGQKAKKGVFITTSSFSKEAIDYADKIENKVILLDGDSLTELMIDYGVGVSTANTYEIKKVDSDYFVDE